MALPQIQVTGTGCTLRRAKRAILTVKSASPDAFTAREVYVIATETAATIQTTIAPYCPKEGKKPSEATIAHCSTGKLEAGARIRGLRDNQERFTQQPPPLKSNSPSSLLNKLVTELSAMQNVRIQGIE